MSADGVEGQERDCVWRGAFAASSAIFASEPREDVILAMILAGFHDVAIPFGFAHGFATGHAAMMRRICDVENRKSPVGLSPSSSMLDSPRSRCPHNINKSPSKSKCSKSLALATACSFRFPSADSAFAPSRLRSGGPEEQDVRPRAPS